MSFPAIIADLDGTLAHRQEGPGQRGWYDYLRCGEDTLDPVIAALVADAKGHGYRILAVTGREERSRQVCIDWFTQHDLPIDELHMRPDGNRDSDVIVKERIYQREIAPDNDVLYVLDDRDSVVAMWRRLGLKCLQVQAGDY